MRPLTSSSYQDNIIVDPPNTLFSNSSSYTQFNEIFSLSIEDARVVRLLCSKSKYTSDTESPMLLADTILTSCKHPHGNNGYSIAKVIMRHALSTTALVLQCCYIYLYLYAY